MECFLTVSMSARMQLLAFFLVPHSTISAQENVLPITPALFFFLQFRPPPGLGSRGICTAASKLLALGFHLYLLFIPPRQLLLLILDTGVFLLR